MCPVTSNRQEQKDLVYFNIACEMSKLSRCRKGGTGAVIVSSDGRLVGAGYTGHPHGWDDTICGREKVQSGTCYEIGYGVHAELNAILHTDFRDRQGATMYTSRGSCTLCAREMVQAGIKRLVTVEPDIKPKFCGLELLRQMDPNIEIVIIK